MAGDSATATNAKAGIATEKRLPDLNVSAPSSARKGDAAIKVSVTVRNRGESRARRSSVAVFMSRDSHRGDGDIRLGRLAVRALAAGASTKVSGSLPLPTAFRSGRYFAIACADSRHRVPELSENNNCSRSDTRMRLGSQSGGAPQFSGLRSATTCIPGPGGGAVTSSRFRLEWEPATDDDTPQAEIVYDIYQSERTGEHDFGAPAYTSAPGAVTFTTPGLASDRAWHFVVRARDRSGNSDGNRIERSGENICE